MIDFGALLRGRSFRVDLVDEATGEVLWSRPAIQGEILERALPALRAALEVRDAARDAAEGTSAIGRALRRLRGLGP